MPQRMGNQFTPPTAEQVSRHLQRHQPRMRSRLNLWIPIGILVAVGLLTFLSTHPTTALLPWIVLGGFVFFMGYRVNSMRNLEKRVSRAQELAMLRQLPQALRISWRLLPDLDTIPELHGRTVALIADTLDRLGCYDAAIIAYDFLIDRLPENHAGSVQLRLARTMVQLNNEQLTDADDSLRRLRGIVDTLADNTVKAAYRLAQIIQRVQTNHFEEAVEESDNLAEELRPLGIDAGYGHALIALSHYHMKNREAAQQWWSTATLLVPTVNLMQRFEQLQPLAIDLQSASAEPPTGAG